MAWDEDSVARSLRRYLSLVLDSPPWVVRAHRAEVSDEMRPVAVVSVGPPSISRARETIPQGEVELVMGATITAYPEPMDSAREARRATADLRTLLTRWVLFGVPVEAAGRSWAGPFRLPLWDYAGVPISGPDRAGPPAPHDVIFVPRESVACEAIQDPDDGRRWAVALDLRCSVEAPGVEIPAEPVASFGGEWSGSGGP